MNSILFTSARDFHQRFMTGNIKITQRGQILRNQLFWALDEIIEAQAEQPHTLEYYQEWLDAIYATTVAGFVAGQPVKDFQFSDAIAAISEPSQAATDAEKRFQQEFEAQKAVRSIVPQMLTALHSYDRAITKQRELLGIDDDFYFTPIQDTMDYMLHTSNAIAGVVASLYKCFSVEKHELYNEALLSVCAKNDAKTHNTHFFSDAYNKVVKIEIPI